MRLALCKLSLILCTLPMAYANTNLIEAVNLRVSEIRDRILETRKNALQISNSEEKEAADYNTLVKNEDYAGALKLVCDRYQLDCKKVSIIADKDSPDAVASTINYTNKIKVTKRAFKYEYGGNQEGWLAAVIGHENVHQKQSMKDRQLAAIEMRVLGSEKLNAVIELEAWEWMLSNKKRLNLTQRQIIDVKSEIAEYSRIITK